ncbi:uncharacterized protein LOC128212867 isoform X2 [Mya arenaria]|nr:uncharacterized protein LOC128212867 isoform X2 [Mya arenaria]
MVDVQRIIWCLLLTAVTEVEPSHFRGAIITWKPGVNQNEVIIDYRISWRMTYAANFKCDDEVIIDGTTIGGTGDIECNDNCAGSIGKLFYSCTDYSISEDWSSGRGRIIETIYPLDVSKPIKFGFKGAAWIDTLNVGGGGNWNLRVTAYLVAREDTNTINSSPTAEIAPIVRLQSGCNHTITVPVGDIDGDIVRCRWADTSEECGEVCHGLPNAELDNVTCSITYSAIYATGWYAVAIQVEDFVTFSSVNALSSIPVQFLIFVYTANENETCGQSMVFINPTPPDDACIGIPEGQVYSSAIAVRVVHSDRSISEIKTTSPLGMTKSSLYQISPTEWAVNITYSPPNDSDVSNVFCFNAKESSGLEGDKRCITLLTGVAPPAIVEGSQSPTNVVYPGQRTWSLALNNSKFTRATRQSFINLYSDNNILMENIPASNRERVTLNQNNRTLTFYTTTILTEKQTYYFTFDFGIVKGVTLCGAESPAIDDHSFWRIKIRDITPPSILFSSPSISNSTGYVQWTINEEVLSAVCKLTRPNGSIETVLPCQSPWEEHMLVEGVYIFAMAATDLEGNSATVKHVWTVDTTPPVLIMQRTPPTISNSTRESFQWTCTYPCNVACNVRTNDQTFQVNCNRKGVVWTLPSTDSNVTYTLDISATDTVGNEIRVKYNWTTDFGKPTITICDKGQSFTMECNSDTKPETICNATASDNMDPLPQLSYTDTSTGSCGITRTWTVIDFAGNTRTYNQHITFTTNKTISVFEYPQTMSVSCGSLSNLTDALSSMFKIYHPCGLDVNITYQDDSVEKCGITIKRTWTIRDGCGNMETVAQYLRIREANTPLAPLDGQIGTELDIVLRWQDPDASREFDIYFWKRRADRPAFPFARTTDNHFKVETSLEPGTQYLWQLVFYYTDNNTYISPVWVFETRHYADLMLDSIETPPTAFSGQTCEIKWTVLNVGTIDTPYVYWYDGVYLSFNDNILGAKRVASVLQRNILYRNDGYSSTATFTLDEREIGNAYIFVKTDTSSSIAELNTTNNLMRSLSTIDVQLTPPPDLQVISIFVSGSRFYSGSEIQLSWTVLNVGIGPTRSQRWYDRVWWSTNNTVERSSKRLADVLHNGGIDKQHNYTVSRAVNIPEFITGDYFILVETDVYDNVYEFLGEDNNVSPMQNSLYVALTPPPDLKITSILTPPLWTTGDTVNISWTVQNIGSETPHSQRYWTDLLVLTSGSNTIIASLLRSHYGSLSVDETYTSTVTFYVVPALPTDKYTLHVTADNRNYLFEYLNEANNEIIQQVTVQQALPDLSVEYFNVTIRYETNRTLINADWSVHNVGIGKTVRSQWFDTISVKTQNQNYFTELQTFQNKHGLLPNESYDSNATIDLPFNVYGDVVFKLTTDLDPSSSGDGYLLNNVKTHSTINIQLRAADLTITAVMLSKYVQAGKGVSITYTVQNVGSLDINSTKWTDRIYISDTIGNLQAILNLNTSLALQADLNKNKTYSKTIGFSLPNEMSGQYYLTVIVNDNAMIFEGPNTENNIVKRELNVEAALSADLYVKKIKANAISFATEEYIVSVEWEVQNIGNSMDTRHEWQDAVFYKHIDSDFNVLNTFKIKHALESQDFYQKKETVVLPSKFSGNIFICVQTVFSGELYEANSTANNVLCSISPITIQMASPPTLSANIGEITSLSDNGTFETGSFVKITYSVENTGESRTSMSSWIDSVYISNVNVESVSDLKRIGWHVKDIVHIGALGTGQKYTATSTFQLPMTFSGRPRIYIVSNNTANDGTGENNTDETTGLAKSPILELSYVLPNLQIVSNIKLPSLHGGQPVIVEYQIVNTGNTSVLGNWFDSVYLSEDIILDAFDYKLKSELRLTTLRPNDSVNVNISFILPVDLQTKTYMLAIVCDSRDEIFEVNENDNEFRIDFRLEARLSTDIAVISVNAPAFSSFGSDMNVKWEIVNNGSKSAQGYKCDSVYLSDNEVWDITDMQIGKPKCSFFTLEANSSSQLSESVSASTPQVAANEYNTLVKSRSNVIDINQENNVAITLQKTRIIYDTINVGETVNRNLVGSLVLRVVNVTDDETLMITVSSNSSINVYLKGGSPATFYDFDISSDDPTSSSQVITFPNTENGDYYLLIESSNIKTGGKQSLAISVKYAVFEIIDIYPRMLIPNAQTTLKIKGAMFSSDMHASIYYNNTSDNNFIAKQTLVFTSGLAYSTFHIPEAASTGPITFQLSSLSLNKTIYYENLLIQNGVKGYISAYKESPGRLRVGETGTFLIRIQNLGDSDVNVPILNVEALGDGSFQLQDDTREEFFRKQYLLFCISDDGPSGILLAKDYCQLDLNVRQDDTQVNFASLSMQVWEITQNERSVNPFMQSKNNLRPSHYDENAWDRVWNNFLTLTGNTSLSMGKKMSSVLNEMSVAGRRVRPVNFILTYLLDFADSPNGDSIIDLQVDIQNPSEKNTRLIVDRLMSSRIGSRSQDGVLGKGWKVPLWDTYIKTLDNAEVVLTLHKEDFLFLKGDEHVYLHQTLGTLTRTDSGFTLRRQDDGNEYVFDRETLKLKHVASLTDGSWLNLEYDQSLLTTIRHSEGSYVVVRYNVRNRIQSMELLNGTANEKVVYEYDFKGELLTSVRTNSDSTTYTYNPDNSLNTISFDDGTRFEFDYNDLGHVKSRRYFISDKEVDRQEYLYTNGGMLSVHSWPAATGYNLTYSESGEIIATHRLGFLPDTVVTTKSTQINYEGDHIVTKRTFGVNSILIEDGNRDSIKAEFNNLGQLIQFKDGRENVYEISVNSNGSIDTVTFPDGTNKTYTYFQNGHQTMTQTGAVNVYEFDENNRLVLKNIGDNMIASYEYDNNGNLERARNSLGEVVISYSDTNVASVAYPDKTINYRYNARNQIREISTNDGYLVKYDFNDLGQMTRVLRENDVVLVTAEYNENGKLKKKTLGNNAYTVYDYDPSSTLLTSLKNFFPNGSLASHFTYTYSIRNRRIAVTSQDGTWKFQYDKAGQVTSMIDPHGNVTRYNYDASKNRQSVSTNNFEVQNTINEMNQYVKYGSTSYDHDKNGNLIQKNGSSGNEVFKYDEENRLVAFHSNGTTCSFKYDAFGHLHSKQCNGRATRYVANIQGLYGADIIEQIESINGVGSTVRFYHGDEKLGLIASTYDNGNVNYFMYDAIGSVVNVLSENGALVNSYQRDPFGNAIASLENVPSIFTFVGQWGVVDIKEIPDVFYMRTRFYDSDTGRFMSPDTFGLGAHSKNFYAYCANNPVSYKDPKGTCPWCLLMLRTAAKGAVTSVVKYGLTTPRNEWTWGGAAGAAVEGAINGAVKPFKKILPGWAKDVISDVANVAGTATQKLIDDEPYSLRDAAEDFGNKQLDRAQDKLEEKFPLFKKFNKICGAVEKYSGYSGAPCDWKDRIKDFFDKLLDDIINWIQSRDPNDMLGPDGYGPARFISKDLTLKYTIRFENDANATAPAQRVYVEHKYSEHLDARHFVLGKFGFGNLTKEMPIRSKIYQDTIDMTKEKGIVVQVFAGLDLVKEVIAWEFQTIDPITGSAPTDPGIGFLPPNNGTSGQGFVSFSIKSRIETPHLSVIHANSSIFFDQNEPIDTPDLFNTIDDRYPIINGSIVPGTESRDSVTLALRALDSGSGVQRIDLFKREGESITLYKSNITEAIFVLPLETNLPQTILPVAVDFVGNRIDLQDIDQESAITVNVTIETTPCECSGNGNCSEGMNVCECMNGFHGTYCNRTTPPVEPPVLEVRSTPGYAREPIELQISARNISGVFEDLSIIISDIPPNTLFSKGVLKGDGNLYIDASKFGYINMTTDQYGEIDLKITVMQTIIDQNLSRSTVLRLLIHPYFETVSVQFTACLAEDKNNSVMFSSSVSFVGISNTEITQNISFTLPHVVSLMLPTWVHPLERYNKDSVYQIDTKVALGHLQITRPYKPFNTSVIVRVQPDGVPLKEFVFEFQVGSECSEGSCDCVENHTLECSPIFKQCNCNQAWQGDRCETDVNECTQPTICLSMPNSSCRNREWGYDCLCVEGYDLQNDTCIGNGKGNITTTTSPQTTEPPVSGRTVSLVIRVAVDLPSTDNLENNTTYETYAAKTDIMLTNYYKQRLGDRLIDVFIRSLSKGSLIVQHDVLVKDEEQALQELSLAIVELLTFTDSNSSGIMLDGEQIAVENVRLGSSNALDACSVFTSLHSCESGCQLDNKGTPTCRPVTKDDSKTDYKVIIIALGVTCACVGLVIVVVVAVRKSRQSAKDVNLNSGIYEADNNGRENVPAFHNPAYGED